jgi:predicted dehydrogenase
MTCLKFGMIGGGQGAFIGAVHRTAACLDHGAVFTAGCLSSTPQRALESGRQLGLADSRNYPTWEAMLEGESKLPKGERIDFVSIVTPNHVHFAPALAFTKAGFHVVCDKPLVHTSQQAAQLRDAVAAAGTVFAVTYNYSGYPMVKHARHLVSTGVLGEIRKIVVEYNQGWLAGKLEETGQKQADWRTDPARSGLGGAIGDIGSHAEQLTSYITGLEISELCADLTTFVAGRRLDDDASVLLRFKGGAKGVLMASQIELGHENDLRIRVHGTKGTLQWRQEEPNPPRQRESVRCREGWHAASPRPPRSLPRSLRQRLQQRSQGDPRGRRRHRRGDQARFPRHHRRRTRCGLHRTRGRKLPQRPQVDQHVTNPREEARQRQTQPHPRKL